MWDVADRGREWACRAARLFLCVCSAIGSQSQASTFGYLHWRQSRNTQPQARRLRLFSRTTELLASRTALRVPTARLFALRLLLFSARYRAFFSARGVRNPEREALSPARDSFCLALAAFFSNTWLFLSRRRGSEARAWRSGLGGGGSGLGVRGFLLGARGSEPETRRLEPGVRRFQLGGCTLSRSPRQTPTCPRRWAPGKLGPLAQTGAAGTAIPNTESSVSAVMALACRRSSLWAGPAGRASALPTL